MAVDLHPDIVDAINDLSHTKLYRRYNRMAKRRYGVRGEILMAKTTAGEFGGRSTRTGRGVVSSAGARGPAQFIPGTRDAYRQQYGVDAWKNDRSAFKAMMLHHLATGVEGYNPGMPTYRGYIMGQRINKADVRALRGDGAGGRSSSLRLQGPSRTEVGLPKYEIPGQSFEAERQDARRNLLLGGDINLKSLLRYKAEVNALQDVPSRTVYGDLQVKRTQGKDVRVGQRATGPEGLQVSPDRIARGKWGGSKLAGRALVRAAGLPVGSRKRSTVNTASGGVSDHWDGNKDSYAWDLMVTGPQGTRIARKLARMLGAKWDGGSWLNVTKKVGGVEYRFQIGWNVPDHYDHIHLGVDRVDTPG